LFYKFRKTHAAMHHQSHIREDWLSTSLNTPNSSTHRSSSSSNNNNNNNNKNKKFKARSLGSGALRGHGPHSLAAMNKALEFHNSETESVMNISTFKMFC